MTKKHFIAVASDVRRHVEVAQRQPDVDAAMDAVHVMAKAYCAVFQRANPLFDEERFMRACGFREEKGDRP